MAPLRLVTLLLIAGLAAAPLPAKPRSKPAPAPAAAPQPPPPSVKAGVELWRSGDYAGAVAMWQPFANAGDADAMFNLGQAYKLGRGGLPKDSVVARDWYRRAAAKGHLPAAANLGILLFQAGEKPEALRWLRTAADKGEMRAQYVLGVANWNGDSLPRNLTLAYAYLARASAQGLPEATAALGNLTRVIAPVERANGWEVATSLAAGNGVPAAFAAGAPAPVAVADSFSRDQVIKPPPRPAPTASTVPSPPPPVAVAAAPPAVIAPAPRAEPVRPAAQAVVAPPRPEAPPPAVSAGKPVAVASAAAPKPNPPAGAAVVAAAVPANDPPPAQTASPASRTVKPEASKPDVTKPSWRVQLGAFGKRALAEAAWSEVKKQQKALVGNRAPIFEASSGVTRLQLGPFASKQAARDACARIAFSGRACFVTDG